MYLRFRIVILRNNAYGSLWHSNIFVHFVGLFVEKVFTLFFWAYSILQTFSRQALQAASQKVFFCVLAFARI